MGQSPQEALVIGIGAVSLAASILAGLCQLLRVGRVWRALLVPGIFLAAYFMAYGKIPPFPPVGAVNKIFYIALFGTVLGLIVDIAAKSRLVSLLLALQPVAAAVYIGEARLGAAPIEVLGAAAAGFAAMWLLRRRMEVPPGEEGMRRALVLAIAALGFAPIALLGASSASLQLCLIFAFAVLATLLWNLRNDDYAFGTSSLLGGAGGMIAVVYAVTLITRKTDLLALAVWSFIFLVPALSDRLPWVSTRKGKVVRLVAFALFCAVPVVCATVIAILSYGSSFPI
ncbi:hypothetical protein [Rhizobium mongolense]|uniref:Uncharacterized protein n=1 Tax=Rhizobium mongolense TaxID=57676 RepID=A0A7W6RKT7_9HYPH|nr:hypothetical protein [Rhizobium mongolense]MBB4273645.1 hypothetical protein [Rhizobium mongolense]